MSSRKEYLGTRRAMHGNYVPHQREGPSNPDDSWPWAIGGTVCLSLLVGIVAAIFRRKGRRLSTFTKVSLGLFSVIMAWFVADDREEVSEKLILMFDSI